MVAVVAVAAVATGWHELNDRQLAVDVAVDPPDGTAAPTPSTDPSRPDVAAPEPPPTPVPPTPSPEPSPAAPPDEPETDDRPIINETLHPGDQGPQVSALQARLVELGYWLGTPDATFDDLTAQAVVAFQKAEGLARDGVVGPATIEALGTAERLRARSTTGSLIEVDLQRQLLLVVRDGEVEWALNTSTGAAATPTPPGQFTIFRDVDGVDTGPLGSLYRPKYFNRGIAIHGYPSVPAQPASHGCTRVSDPAMDLLWSSGATAIETEVWVY